MADPRILLATAIDDSAEALYRIVADIPDPVAKAQAALSAVDQIQGHLLPDLVSIRRAAIREARQRMSAQELADRLGMSRSRVYAVLAGADNATGPLTIHYRTAAGGVGEAPVAWTVEPLRGTRRIRVTREEIRYRRTAQVVMVVVPADSVDVEPTPTDSRLDGAFRSLENQAAYALSQADLAAQHAPGWHPNTNTAPRRRGLALPGRWGALATVAPYPIGGCPQLVGPARPLLWRARAGVIGGGLQRWRWPLRSGSHSGPRPETAVRGALSRPRRSARPARPTPTDRPGTKAHRAHNAGGRRNQSSAVPHR